MSKQKHSNIAFFIPHEGCPHQCSFCNQNVITSQASAPTVDYIKTESRKAVEYLGENAQKAQIAFFGGSFTALPKEKMISYLSAVSELLPNVSGIRVSTRPDCIDTHVLDILKQYGVTAIELGAQSMQDDVLMKNHRGHSAKDTVFAASLIKSYGFELGLQMMTGLAGDTPQKALYTADELIKLCPDTMRIYPTVVLKETYLAKLYEDGNYTPQTLDEAVELCAALLIKFHSAGITVIRTGLHTLNSEDYLAGAFHPAFKALCDSKIYFDLLNEKLKNITPCRVKVYTMKSALSKMAGHKRQNLELFENMGYKLKIYPLDSLNEYEIKIDF